MPLLVRGLAGMGALAAMLSLISVGAGYLDWLALAGAVGETGLDRLLPPSVPRISGVGDHVNILAMSFNLALPFAAALALSPFHRNDRVFGVIALLLTGAALFFTVSRGAWLAGIAAVPVFVALYALRRSDPGSIVASMLRRRVVTIGVAGAVLVVLLVGVLGASRWDSRPEWLFRASLSPRQDAASAGLDIFRDRPWLGAGPYTYSLLYNVYSGRYPIENIHPHNGYIGALVDTGLAGAMVLLAGGAVVGLALWRGYRNGSASGRVLVAAAAAALTTLLVHSLLDTPNAWTTALLPLAVVLALVRRLAPASGLPRVPVLSAAARSLVLLLVPLAVAGWVNIDRVHPTYEDSLQDLANGRFLDATSHAAAAADADPYNAAYQINAGVTSAIVYMVDRRGEFAGNVALIDDAIARFEKAVAAEPRSAIGYANLALALRLRAARQVGADRDDSLRAAADAASEAIVRASTDAVIASIAGTVFEAAKQDDDAVAAYSRAVSHDAGLVQSPFWTTSPLRTARRDPIIDASDLTPCEKGRVTAMYAGYRDDLTALAEQCRAQVNAAPLDARARSDLSVILYGLGRREEAHREAKDAVARVPDSPYARTALAISLMPDGDLAAVRHELLLGGYLGDPDAALLLAYTYEPPVAANPLISNLKPPIASAPMPGPVAELLDDALGPAAPIVFDGGTQRYLLGVLYYRVRFLRESPTSILVPGEWLTLSSPRALLLLEAINRHERQIDAK